MSIRATIADVAVRLGSVQALDGVDLTAEPGQFVALLGPSGSGKTTTLNVLAGFVKPDRGTVAFDAQDMTAVPPHRRDLGIVFQSYALFPHMSVAQNVAFPLRMRNVPRDERGKRINETLDLVGLGKEAGRSVATLSGGQKQRVALARAIVFEPRLMLLDEPLAALDKQLRDQMQLELRRLQRRVGITTIAVTHDQVEALTMADVVAVMRDGHVEQVGPPQDVYLRPATLFVATFLGEANLVPVDNGRILGLGSLNTSVSGQAVIRPEHVSMCTEDTTVVDGDLRGRATIQDVAFQGARFRARVRLSSNPHLEFTVSQPSGSECGAPARGDEVEIVVDRRMVHVIPGRERQHNGDEIVAAAGLTR
jgi:putative spermidine/putrescine transport system ATP-binding protein